MTAIPAELIGYHEAGKPLVCALDVSPFRCEFWPAEEIEELNEAYSVAEFAPGYMGFASSGGGEMFAWSPDGSIVCLAFVGMSPAEALPIAMSWARFERMLRSGS